eukprot:jgi/Undpi1/3143/HiC_scaffold_15.g06517.m1
MKDFGTPNSVAYSPVNDELAIAVAAHDVLTKGQAGPVAGFRIQTKPDAEGIHGGATLLQKCACCDDYVQILTTGYLPDMVTFTPNGRRILTANEGEPLDYTEVENDPVGSVSIFKRKKSTETYREACEVGFEEFDTPTKRKKLVKSGVRVSGANFTTPSMDMEPEYIAVTDNSKKAYVTLQENNAVAKININKCEIDRIFPLGYKEWGNGVLFDASDKDGKINLQDWPTVKGMYMPDAITTFKAGGARYFVTANEGDGREYGDEDASNYYTDEIRVEDLAVELGFDATESPYDETNLGRLKVTSAAPFTGDIDELYAFGGRSISIFSGDSGELVWDSGDFIATYIADPDNGFSELFNSEGGADSFDERSDDKGSEPEGLAIAEIDGSTYVFLGLERTGGWMCWEVSDPTAPVFQSYTNSYEDDVAPESAAIIPAEYSPSGKALLVAVYEDSNTLAVFEISTD